MHKNDINSRVLGILLLNGIFSTFYYRPRTIGSAATKITIILKIKLYKTKTKNTQKGQSARESRLAIRLRYVIMVITYDK